MKSFAVMLCYVLLLQFVCVLQTSAQDSLQTSIQQIHNEVVEQEMLESRQANATAQAESILGAQERDRTVLSAEEGATLDGAATAGVAARVGLPWASQQIIAIGAYNHDIHEVQFQGDYIALKYLEVAKDAQALAQQRQLSLLKTALNLEERLASNKGKPGDAQPELQGTNLYVQNYYVPIQN